MLKTVISIRPNAPIGTISPRLYGQFAEHLGRCCYDGLWVGEQSGIPNRGGFRTDVLDALKALPVPLLRWPGGCYADHYHWRDGIGPKAERPTRIGISCGLQVEDDNSLGLHEFMYLCSQLGAEPYLAGNVGSGTPQELCDWVEYSNCEINTSLAQMRKANGAAKPFGVKLWGVGNENWGCGGNFDAATYAREYRRFATMLRHVDPGAELVIAGSGDAGVGMAELDDWNTTLLKTLNNHLDLVDHLSIHHYWTHGGAETEFSDQEYYAMFTEAEETERFVKRTAEIIKAETGGRRPIGIAMDEWGVWHPEARPWGPGDVIRRSPTTYEQANTMRDALAAGIALEGFHRQCSVLSAANLAQIVNVLQSLVMTEGNRIWLTPTYHVFRLHTPHIGATALTVDIKEGQSLGDGSSAVSATASRSDRGIAFTLINRHISEPASVTVSLTDGPGEARGQILSAPTPNAVNTAAQPDCVALTPLTVNSDSPGKWRIELPAHSMATVELF